jgi:ribonuclease D
MIVKHKPDFFEADLPSDRLAHYLKKSVIAVDTETRGLVIARDRLCLVQLCDDEGIVSLVRYTGADAPNLRKLMEEPSVLKLFHYARFDVAVMKHWLKASVNPIWCTKIASKLVRTYTDRHSLKDLSLELLGIEMDKVNQSSDWARTDLSDSQLEYAANDVRGLITIYEQLQVLLKREGLTELANKLFAFLPVVAELDLSGRHNIFEH